MNKAQRIREIHYEITDRRAYIRSIQDDNELEREIQKTVELRILLDQLEGKV